MAKRIPKHTVIVVRENVQIAVKAGEEFDFVPAEIKDLERLDALQPAPATKAAVKSAE